MTTEPTTYPQHFYAPASNTAQVLLIRHGQSEAFSPKKPFPLVDGHGDPALSQLGQFQAQRLATRLASENIAAIYVSTLTRTHQTAAPLAAKLDIEPVVEPDLREVFLGEGEGGRFREMSANGHPSAVALATGKDWGMVPGAETNAQLTSRTVSAVEKIANNHPNQLVAAVCHGGVIAAVLGHTLGLGAMELLGARHTSINHLVVPTAQSIERQWTLRTFNDGAHAGPLTSDDQP